jgi:hypothetical protein
MSLYKILRIRNDVRAVSRALSTGSTKPLTNRVGRRLFGKAAGRLQGRLFPPYRGR